MKREFRKIGTDELLPYNTLSISVDRQVILKVEQPIYDSEGHRLSIKDLADLCGLEILVTPDQTDEYIEYHKFVPLFEANPDLETRVQEYKAFFDELEIGYDSNTDEMEAAIREKIPAAQQVEYVQRMQTALTNVKVNYQAALAVVEDEDGTGNDFETWLHTPLLIKYMPSSHPVVPEYKAPYVETEDPVGTED